MKAPVQRTLEEPSTHLQFSQEDGRLYQQWLIYEWGNPEGLGRAMNRRVEWRPVPVGPLAAVSTPPQEPKP